MKISSMKYPDTCRRTYRRDEASDLFCGFASVPISYTPCKLIFWPPVEGILLLR